MIGLYSDLYVTQVYDDNGMWIGQDPAVSPSTYIFFAAVAVFAIAALWGQRLAIAERISRGPADRAARGAHRFTTLAIIIGLAISAILAISTFLRGFGTATEIEETLSVRLFGVYLPILLYTALTVWVLLAGFVFRKDTLPKSSDKVADGVAEESGGEVAGSQRDLGLSYALPIIAAAIALIFGLVVYDVTGTTLEVWIWVVIQILIATGVVAGTIYAERAVHQGPTSNTSRSRITRGARGLNFVLSIVFGAVVTGMAFGYGGSAIDSLRISPAFYLEILAGPGAPIENADVGVTGRDLKEGSDVSVTLSEPVEVLFSEEVTDSDYFYQTRPLPGGLEEGDYLLSAEATSIDGRVLGRELEFSVSEEGNVFWDAKYNYDYYNEEDATIRDADLGWLIEDFLPALVLLTLALGGVYLTLTERNRAPRGLGLESAKG